MKKSAIIFIVMICFLKSVAQKQSSVWIFGYHYYPLFIPALDFYYGPPYLTGSNTTLEFDDCDASICTPNGDLLFYTDGATVMNYLHDTIPGSQHFNDDSLLVATYGYMPVLYSQSAFILPYPGNHDRYAIIHHSEHGWNSNQSFQPINLSMSIVDMSMNAGAGQMILKNQNILNDTLLFRTLQAVRHANGRDWWIIAHKWKSKNFYLMLLTPSGITNLQLVQAGPHFTTGANAQSLFSPNGNYFAMARGDSAKVALFYFDRCTGMLSSMTQIDLSSFTTSGLTGCSFSPNNRFLYVTNGLSLYQYDMNAPNIQFSQKLIASWDGSGSFYPYYFMMHQIGPDGKIYIAAPPSDVLHVINKPDLLDTACNFTQHSITLLSWYSAALPVFPNYNLGADSGSVCDSLNWAALEENTKVVTAKLFPNPNNGDFQFEYNLTHNKEGRLEITDATGRIIFENTLSKWSYTQHINLQPLKHGIYFLKFSNGSSSVRQKFIVMD